MNSALKSRVIGANVQSASDIEREVAARIDHPAATVVEENVNVRVGSEISADFDIDISAGADVASWVGRFIIVLEVAMRPLT